MTPFEQAQQQLAGEMAAIEASVGHHYPHLLDTVKFNLAVAANTCVKDAALPIAAMNVGLPGVGKTLSLDLMMPDNLTDPLNTYFYRTDRFTMAAFVTNRADITAAQAASIDLLPKIVDHTVLVKEASPIFAGRETEVRERLAVLTSILDGKGYTNDTGSRGRRGYIGTYVFQLLGCTTPLNDTILALIAQLGPRLLFYNVERPRKTLDELLALAKGDVKAGYDDCRQAVRRLLLALYSLHKPRTLDGALIAFSDEHLLQLVLWTKALVALRVVVYGNGMKGSEEHPERVLHMLKPLTLGSALVHGRSGVADYDLAQVAHVAMSSGVANRGNVLRAVLINKGAASAPEIELTTGLSRPTVLAHMEALGIVGLAKFTKGTNTTAGRVELISPFDKLCDAPLLAQPGTVAP